MAAETESTGIWTRLRFRLFETGLATLCAFLPALLLLSAGTKDRDSISAYYDMDESQIFYYGLTVAAMLFMVNGVLRSRNYYYAGLGVLLSGVIWFNHDEFDVVHTGFAWGFFLGGIVVIFGIARGDLAKKIRPFLAAFAVAALAGHFFFGVPSFFYAEWFAMLAIAAHFVLHAWLSVDSYEATSSWRLRNPATPTS